MTLQPTPAHLLLSTVRRCQILDALPSPADAWYSLTEGAWMSQDTGGWLVTTPDMPRLATKKADIETGEDQKGA